MKRYIRSDQSECHVTKILEDTIADTSSQFSNIHYSVRSASTSAGQQDYIYVTAYHPDYTAPTDTRYYHHDRLHPNHFLDIRIVVSDESKCEDVNKWKHTSLGDVTTGMCLSCDVPLDVLQRECKYVQRWIRRYGV